MASYDLVVVGGGVQGLSIARAAISAGLKVVLLEARACGAGASGGLLGALMPHLPTGWSEKKQFQFDALLELEAATAALNEETGIDPGFERCGRAMPVRTPGFRDQFRSRRDASRQRWHTEATGLELQLLDADALKGWLDPDAAPLGVFWDPLAARIDPGRYVDALKASLEGGCDVFENCRFAGFDGVCGKAVIRRANGSETLAAGNVVLAAGYETYELIRDLYGFDLGAGVKGQAALLSGRLPRERPIIYDDGMYIVAHTSDRCAVGSTTEPDWTEAAVTDRQIEARVEHARKLCPPLRDAPVLSTWAGIRPNSAARDPIVGRLLPDQTVYVATGGFKITFGIAHRVARELVEGILAGEAPKGLPATFSPHVHVAAAQSKATA